MHIKILQNLFREAYLRVAFFAGVLLFAAGFLAFFADAFFAGALRTAFLEAVFLEADFVAFFLEAAFLAMIISLIFK